MEYRPLDITVVSAKDLKDVNLMSKMDVYVVVSISGDPRTKQKTPVDKDGGTSPKWHHHPMKFSIDDALANQNRLSLVFTVRSDRSLGDKDIGEVHVPIKELLDNAGDGKSERTVSYQVRMPNGKVKGTLNFSYMFGEKFTVAVATMKNFNEPVMAYPMAGGASSAYPQSRGYHGYPPAYPPQAGYHPSPVAGYGYPPPTQAGYGGYPQAPPGYGYPPPQQAGYGYPPVQQKKKKNNFGMGLGAGLLGGLLVGDMLSDVGEYDAGFDDAGGFDF